MAREGTASVMGDYFSGSVGWGLRFSLPLGFGLGDELG